MKAAFFRRHGGPEVMEVGDLPAPVPGPGQVLVSVRAAALNHIDLWLRRGLPALPVEFPHVLGADVCGVVAACGPGIAAGGDLIPGARVVVNPGISCGRCPRCLEGEDNLCPAYQLIGEQRWGGQAEAIAVPASNVVAAPDGVPDEVLAAVPTVYMTAWQMLVDKAKVRHGETVVVFGAGSGVGVAALQIARLCGARVIAVASTEEKRKRAKALGAYETLDSEPPDELARRMRGLTGGRGADVVFEHTGSATFPAAIKGCAKGGRVVTCGATSGYDAQLDLRYVFWRQLSILGSTMAPKGRLFSILRLVAEGTLAPVVDQVFALEDVVEAHRRLESPESFGKLVLRLA